MSPTIVVLIFAAVSLNPVARRANVTPAVVPARMEQGG
jgi:hypothetical protein